MRTFCILVLIAVLLLPACYHNAELMRRAEEGDPVAQYEYARRLLTGQKGVAPDAVRAAETLQPAAVSGYAPAQALLALCYERGLGVPKSPTEAHRLYTMAAEQGSVPACRALVAQELRAGKRADALRWLRSMAEQGNPAAQLQLGKLCLRGEKNAATDAEGIRYLRYAAMQGEREACLLMATCYAEGRGVPQDDALAQGWLRNAKEAE